jgi:hypothetical protein
MTTRKASAPKWEFKARFRRGAFGWKSEPAILRIRQAVSEITKVARTDPVLAAEGAVAFLERISPALEHVDGSSGAIGTAVNRAIDDLTRIIAGAPSDPKTRADWLSRLWAAYDADEIPYIEALGDHWGELCGSAELASEWADSLMDTTRMALSPDPSLHGYFRGTSACLSALFRAARYQEIIDIVEGEQIWSYKQWAVRALAAMGKTCEAIAYSESLRGRWVPDRKVDSLCEEILLASGFAEEAFEHYAARNVTAGTYLASFRSTARRYPHKQPAEILARLVRATPGCEGKWFAAAKEAGLFDEALALATQSPCDPKTLTRAARDFMDVRPGFSAEAGFLAIRWVAEGHGYEITSADVSAAYDSALRASERIGTSGEMRMRIKDLVSANPCSFVARSLDQELER